jgi:hypothetical protein
MRLLFYLAIMVGAFFGTLLALWLFERTQGKK